ncbi:MAG: histidine kinase dimerization/phosphoacceptor domain-containing protein [Micropruina sp.]
MTAHVYDPEQAGWRREPATAEQVRIDTLAAAGLFLLGVLSIVLTRAMGIFGDQGADPVVSVIMVAAVILPLALRRRFPSVVAVVVAAGFVVGGELRVEETLVINLALFCAIYTVGAWEADRRRAAWVRGGLIAVMAGWMVIAMFRIGTSEVGLPGEGVGALTPGVALMLWQIVINVLYFAGAYWFGEHAWNAARQRAIIEHHTRQLAAQQARVAAQAVTIERLRIARELHDAVAHHVSLMGVQAAAARAVIGRDVEAARAQLAGLEDSARLAVAELYELLGTLRDDDDPHPAPDPATAGLGLDGLPGLVAEAESAGLEVSPSTIGAPQPVPPLVGLNLYRIAQRP